MQSSMASGWNWKRLSSTAFVSSSVGLSRSTHTIRPLSPWIRRSASSSRSRPTSLPSLKMKEWITGRGCCERRSAWQASRRRGAHPWGSRSAGRKRRNPDSATRSTWILRGLRPLRPAWRPGASSLRRAEQLVLQLDHRGDESFRSLSGEQRGAAGLVLDEAAERTNEDEVIGRIVLRGAQHEHELHVLVAVLEMHTIRAAAHGQHDLLHVLGAGMRQGHFVAQAGGVEALAREELIVEARKIGDVGVVLKKPGDLLQRRGAFGALDREKDVLGDEQAGKTRSHDLCREKDSGAWRWQGRKWR